MDIIAVADYPRTKYSAYWEIGIDGKTFKWTARLYDWGTGNVLVEQSAAAPSMAVARNASQTWVRDQIERFKR